jgi:antitoxin ParD1/3/4
MYVPRNAMNIPLRPDQEDWLKAQVAGGRFTSLEEAVASAVAGLRAQEAVDDAWAQPLIDEALAALDRGEGTPWRKGEALERIKARLSGT